MNRDYWKCRRRAAVLQGALLALIVQSPLVSARTFGMVTDHITQFVTVFDADTDTVLGSITIPQGANVDVAVTPDQRRGFVTGSGNQVFVIDLTASPPRLADGPNPILISNSALDLSISPDGKFLVVSNGSAPQPISVIDIASQTEINTLFVGSDTNSVDVCSDGSVLATSSSHEMVRRHTINGSGILSDTGEVLRLSFKEPNNVFCAPGGASGLVISRGGLPFSVRSFKIPGLELVDTRALSGETFGIAGLVNFAGNRVFTNDGRFVDVFGYNAITASLSAAPLFSIPISGGPGFFGVDPMALHPYKTKLYVSQPYTLNVYDANTGALLKSITDPNIVDPTGVAVATAADPCVGRPPTGAIVGTAGPDGLRGTPGNDVIFGLDGNDVIDGRGGDDLICGGPGIDVIRGGSGDDVANGGSGRDVISGGSGNDRLQGGSGNDMLLGGPGDDLLEGGAGRDLVNGNSGRDIVRGGR